MAIRKVAQLGHPVLRKVAAEVSPEQIASPDFQRLCDDLLETMHAYEGLGLAAPQIHESLRLLVFQLDEEDGPIFLINPVVKPLTTQTSAGYEGCLSLTNMRGRVERPKSVRVEALDREGTKFAFLAHGWAARVVQHECDHLDGVLYLDRADPRSMAFLPEYRRFGALVPVCPQDPEDEGEEEGGDEGE
jgi:peptide deformylase